MIQLDWPPSYTLALGNTYQPLDLCICVPSAWGVVPLHLHGVVVFYSSPWPHCTCYVLREDFGECSGHWLLLYLVCFSQHDFLLLPMCLFPASSSGTGRPWGQHLAFGLVLCPHLLDSNDWHIQGINKYLLKEWRVDYVSIVDGTLKSWCLFRKNSILSLHLIFILIIVNALFPKQKLTHALWYIRGSKRMCGTIDFFLFLRKKNESTV